MKKTKIVVPALAVLLLSTAASVSGTVAWFSMNTQIKVTGMTVTTKVSSNLQIAIENNDALFKSEDLDLQREGILEPASTVDGNSFWYTVKANNNGAAQGTNPYAEYDEATNALGTDDAAVSGKTYYDEDFNGAYGFVYSTDSDDQVAGDDGKGNGNVSFAYIDYSFYLKAYTTTANEKISLTRCNMKYNDASLTNEHAWRVGFFAHEITTAGAQEDDATTTSTDGALKSIMAFAESKNQNQIERVQVTQGYSIPADTLFTNPELTGNALAEGTATAQQAGTYYKAKDNEAEPKAVNGQAITALGAVEGRDTTNHKGAKAEIVPAATGKHVYKVVVRLWLEGEDVTCTSDTFASLTDAWTLDLGFKLGGDDGVQVITNNAPVQNA